MAELRELLARIPRPPRADRVAHRSPLSGAGRYAALFATAVAAFLLFVLLPAAPRAGLLPTLRLYGPPGLFGLVFAALLVRNVRLRRVVFQNADGIFLAASGRSAEAATLYARLSREVRGTNPYHALFVGNRGVAACAQGDLASGRPLLAEAMRSGWFDAPRPTAPSGYFAAWLSRADALEGDLPSARAWREVADALLPTGRKAMLLATDAILHIRAGQPGRAADAIAGAWMGAEGELPAHERRILRTLHAYALGLAGREPEVEPVLAGLWPPVPGALEVFLRTWPELAGFLTGRSVTRQS